MGATNGLLRGVGGLVTCMLVGFERPPWFSGCIDPKRACISGSSKTRLLCSVSLCLN